MAKYERCPLCGNPVINMEYDSQIKLLRQARSDKFNSAVDNLIRFLKDVKKKDEFHFLKMVENIEDRLVFSGIDDFAMGGIRNAKNGMRYAAGFAKRAKEQNENMKRLYENSTPPEYK